MSQVKINVDGKERIITMFGAPDKGNPITMKIIEYMCRKADKAKEGVKTDE